MATPEPTISDVLAAIAALEERLTARIAAVETRLTTVETKLEAMETRFITQINTKLDDILDKLSAVRADTDTTKGHLLYVMSDSLTLGQRITKLEEELRRRSEGG